MRLHNPSPSAAAWIGGIAIALLFAALLLDAFSEREREISRATRQLAQHDHILAEHVARSLDSIEVLLDEMAAAISESGWQNWSSAEGHQRMQRHLTRSLPQIRHLILFDADGMQRHTSFAAVAPAINVKDRPYFRQILDGAERARYGPYIGRNSNRWTYAVVRRLSAGPKGKLAGVLMVAIEPEYFEEFCRATRPHDAFEAAVVSGDGRVIALCSASKTAPAPVPLPHGTGDDFRHVLARGEFADTSMAIQQPLMESKNYFLTSEPVAGYADLRVVSAIPKLPLFETWMANIRPMGILALCALIALTLAISMIRRQLRSLATLTDELHRNRDNLESRISAATAELVARRTDAERLAESKSRFFAAASHDLRQPLHALSLFVGDLSRITDTPEQRVLIERIETAAKAMTGQLRSLLDISRLDMANIVPQRVLQPLPGIFDQLSATYSATAEDAGVRLLFRPRNVTIETDPALLLRLLGNLIDNAIKFSPQGSVLICARWRANAVRIEVRDNGKGIADAHKKAIYDEFYQIGNTARDPGAGLGLGLAIAHRIARLLGTNISLRSAPGSGSVFSMTLPCVSGNRTIEAEALLPETPRLVLIGDAAQCADFAERAKRWGYDAEIAETLATAWRMLGNRKGIPVLVQPGSCLLSGEHQSLLRRYPGVVVTAEDCEMPELGAYQLREPIRPARLRALLRSLH